MIQPPWKAERDTHSGIETAGWVLQGSLRQTRARRMASSPGVIQRREHHRWNRSPLGPPGSSLALRLPALSHLRDFFPPNPRRRPEANLFRPARHPRRSVLVIVDEDFVRRAADRAVLDVLLALPGRGIERDDDLL